MNRCGQIAGYRDHMKNGTPTCAPCRRAHADERARYRRRRYLHHAPLSVDATGTRRRIQALAAIGWSLNEQSRRMGQQRTWANKATTRAWVTVETAARVAALYDELAMTPGPSMRARCDAVRRGWPVPLAWDDDEIDDPSAGPIAAPNPSDGRRNHELEQRIMEMTAAGLSNAEIAMRLKTYKRYVTRVRSRHRNDLDVAS